MRNHLFRSKGFYGFRASYHGPRKCYECKNTNQVSVSVSVSNTAREGLHQQALSKLGKNHQFLGDRLEQNMQHALQQLSYRVVFSSLVPPNFSTKKKTRQAANHSSGFTGTAALIGWFAVFFLVLKLGGTSKKITLYHLQQHQHHSTSPHVIVVSWFSLFRSDSSIKATNLNLKAERLDRKANWNIRFCYTNHPYQYELLHI